MNEPRVHVDIADATLRLAITYVVERAGLTRARDESSADVTVVSTARAGGPCAARVLVVDSTPAACRAAVQAVVDGRASTVVCADEPDRVPDAVRALSQGWAALPTRVLDTARHGPVLDGRAMETLTLVLAGRTNRQIARRLYQSESTVKRDIAALLRSFDVTSRIALVARASALGYGRPPLSHSA